MTSVFKLLRNRMPRDKKKRARPILIIENKKTFESDDLVAAGKRLAIPVATRDIQSAHEDIPDDAGLVYWRSATVTKKFSRNEGRATFLARLNSSVKIVNRTLVDTPQYVYKSVQQARFGKFRKHSDQVLPIPTYLASDRRELEELLHTGRIAFPFIAKPNLGMRGKGVELIAAHADLDRIREKIPSMVFQNFITNTGDYRVLVIGGVAHDIIFRTATPHSKKPFVNNVSQGGMATRVTDEAKRKKLAKAGCIIASTFNYTVCGVDLIEDADGTLYFLEINSVPQWKGLRGVTPHDVAEHVLLTLEAIAKDPTDVFSDVRDYFFKKLKYFPVSQQFHWLSRCYLWSGKKRYKAELDAIHDAWSAMMKGTLKRVAEIRTAAPRSYASIKKSYKARAFAAHHSIERYNHFFFRCLFDRIVFGGDSFERHKSVIDLAHLKRTRANLVTDPASVFELSTPAVNFLYLCDYFFPDEGMGIDPAFFVTVGETEKLPRSADDIDARVYLYTHAIICASRFYSEPIDATHTHVYVHMLKTVEALLAAHYAETTLDHKCEFLVCAKLCGYQSSLEQVIRSELAASVSAHGLYFINRHNVHASNPSRHSMLQMEHTNVLALMAFLGHEGI